MFAAGVHLLALVPLAWATQRLLGSDSAEREARVQVRLLSPAQHAEVEAMRVASEQTEPAPLEPAPLEPAPPPSIIPPLDPPPPTVPEGPLALHVPAPSPTVWATPTPQPEPSESTHTAPTPRPAVDPASPRVAAPPKSRPQAATRARVRRRPEPDYPSRCRRRGHTGVVRVRVLIGADGAPKRTSLARSANCARLDAAALAAVQRYRFHPATLDGRRVTSSEVIEVRFRAKG